MRITVFIKKVIYKNEENDYFVAVTDNDEKIVGYSAFVGDEVVLTFEGEWKDDPRWGPQFVTHRTVIEDDSEAILLLLQSGFLKHISEKRAVDLWNNLGNKVFQAMDECLEDPGSALCQMFYSTRGVGPVTGPDILESWQAQRTWAHDAMVGVQAGLTVKQIRKVRKAFPFASLKEMLDKEPYKLLEVLPWVTVDGIALQYTKIAPDSPVRYAAAISKTLQDARNRYGHTYLPVENGTIEGAMDLVGYYGSPNQFIDDAEAHFQSVGLKVFNEGVTSEQTLERSIKIVDHIFRIQDGEKKPVVVDMDNVGVCDGLTLSDEQISAVLAIADNNLVLMTGGAGTGKTTVIKKINEIMEANGYSTTIACLAGKAAARASEATGHDASTIHSTLGIYSAAGSHQVDSALFIIDEASMLDESLMETVLWATRAGNKLLLVGDNKQLPPIGAGKPFIDMIDSGIVTQVDLKTIHRQGRNSGIVTEAAKVSSGVLPDYGGLTYDDFKLINVGNNGALLEYLITYVEKVQQKYGYTLDDMMLLSPVKKGDYGVNNINERIQAIHNPGPFILDGVPYKIGDRVMQTKNDHRREVFNGEVGKIVWLSSVERLKLAEDEWKENGYKGDPPPILMVDYESPKRTVVYTRDDLLNLSLGYCFTAHKAQGSEAPCVIMALPVVGDFVDQKMVYTMITRAKKYCLIFAANGAMEIAVKQKTEKVRYTMLPEIIKESVYELQRG